MKKYIKGSFMLEDMTLIEEYYDVYLLGDENIGALAIEYDIPVDEMIEEQTRLCEYNGLKLVGFGEAKSEYYDAFAENDEEFVVIVNDGDRVVAGIFVGDSFVPINLDGAFDILNELDDFDDDEDFEEDDF